MARIHYLEVIQNQLNTQDYTKHYVYEPDSFVPLLQTGYTRFIQLMFRY
ncbi:hypothetical protein [Acinetobacter bereziniae]|nr:hypothetical protein [Acinetobacter bereziniae]